MWDHRLPLFLLMAVFLITFLPQRCPLLPILSCCNQQPHCSQKFLLSERSYPFPFGLQYFLVDFSQGDMPKNYKQDIVRREEGTTSPYTTPQVLQLVLACTLYSSSSCSTTCRKATYAAKREILYTAYWCQVPRCHGATHHARHARHAVRSMPLCWSDGGRWEDWYR